MMKYILSLLLWTSGFNTPGIYAQTTCEELTTYRDVTLLQTWDNLHDQVIFNATQVADYQRWKQELLSDYNNVSIGTLLSAINGLSNLITNTYELVTPTGKVISIAKIYDQKTVDKITTVKAINGGINDVETLYSEGIAGYVKSKVVDKMGFFGSLYTKMSTLAEDLKTFNDFNQSRNEIKNMLKQYDKLIEQNNVLLEQSRGNMQEFNNYLNYITAYLVDNC